MKREKLHWHKVNVFTFNVLTFYILDGLREHEAILDKLISITRDNKGETNMILA